MLSRFMKSCICALLVLLATTRASVLVTIQSQSQEEMDALTAAVDTAARRMVDIACMVVAAEGMVGTDDPSTESSSDRSVTGTK